jgi:hypothetical protein
MKQKENEFYTTSIYKIDRILEERYAKEPPDDLDNEKLVQERLPYVYRPYQDVFSKGMADQLLEHRSYNHKIVLTGPLPNQFSPLYKQSTAELKATKKYIMENLQKGFINHSQSPFASPILCVSKPNRDIRIC